MKVNKNTENLVHFLNKSKVLRVLPSPPKLLGKMKYTAKQVRSHC